MPTNNLNVNEIQTQASNERADEVKKELVKKYKVIAKRRGTLDAHLANFNAKVKKFEDDVAAAETPEQIMAALSTHKFPYHCINLQASRED